MAGASFCVEVEAYFTAEAAATVSALSFTSPIAAFSRICSGLVAPQMTVAVTGFAVIQPTASCVIETPASAAICSHASSLSKLASVYVLSAARAFRAMRVPSRAPAPRLCLPVRKPPASGL